MECTVPFTLKSDMSLILIAECGLSFLTYIFVEVWKIVCVEAL